MIHRRLIYIVIPNVLILDCLLILKDKLEMIVLKLIFESGKQRREAQ